MIGVNVLTHTPETLKEVTIRENLDWRTFADSTGDIARQWNAPGTPTFYVIDPKGTIRHKWVGHPGENMIDEALDKLIQEAEKTTAPK